MKKLVIIIIAAISLLSVKSIAQVSANTSSSINSFFAATVSDCNNEETKDLSAKYAFNAKLSLSKAEGTFKLAINSPVHGYAIVNVTDMMGRQVMSEKTNVSNGINNKEFDLSKLSKGLYNVQIITNNSSRSLRMML
jgi:hypothetical protein